MPAPWDGLPPELESAAKEIAITLNKLTGGLAMRAADPNWHPRQTGDAPLSDYEKRLWDRYKVWASAMRADKQHIGYVIDILGCDAPVTFAGLFHSALRLYDKVNNGRRSPKDRSTIA